MSYAIVRGKAVPAQLYMDQLLEEAGVKPGAESLARLYLHCMKKYPDDIALINCDTGVEISNATLLRSIARYARAAAGRGAHRAAIVMPNSEPQVTLFYALIASDIIPIMLDYNVTSSEMKYFVELQEPQLVFCDASTREVVVAGTRDAACDLTIVCSGDGDATSTHPGVISLDQFAEGYSDDWTNFSAVRVSKGATALLIPTSGSTGKPKAACITHEGLTAMAHQLWYHNEVLPRPVSRILLISTPQWLTHTIILTTSPMFRVTVLVSAKSNTTENLAYNIGTYKAEWFLCSPVTLAMLSAAPPATLASLRNVVVCGSAPAQEVIQMMKRKLSPLAFIQNGLGMTEIHGFVTLQPRGSPEFCLGPVLNTLLYKIVDKDGKELTKPNEVGELHIKNDLLLIKEYHKNRKALDDMVRDGWLVTGDLVYQNEAGYIFYHGRNKFTFKINNYQVSPEEVEEVIGSVPGVLENYVGPTPGGAAALVVSEPHVDLDQLIPQIRTAVEESLSVYKRLTGGVWAVKCLPHTSNEKLQRHECQIELERIALGKNA